LGEWSGVHAKRKDSFEARESIVTFEERTRGRGRRTNRFPPCGRAWR
jgi:hypothetical protein